MYIIILWVIFCFVAAFVGADRKIGFFGAFIVSLLLSPIIGIIIALASKNKQTDALEKKLLGINTPQKPRLTEKELKYRRIQLIIGISGAIIGIIIFLFEVFRN